MTLARQIIPGSIYLITRRCLERRRFLAPDKVVNDLFAYLLAVLSERHGVEVLAAVQMSNHYHAVVHDRFGNVPAFMRDFHGLLGRGANRRRGRSDAFWSADQANLVELGDAEAVVDRMAYVLCNPVAAGLVERGRDWPGTRTPAGACASPPRIVRKPRGFLREEGPFPDEAELVVCVPPTHGHMRPSAFSALLSARVRALEDTLGRELRAAGRHFPPARDLRRIPWDEAPTTASGLFSLNPRAAARDGARRLEILGRQHTFLIAYRRALKVFRGGSRDITFPGGTWMLPKVFGTQAADPPGPAWR